MLNASVAHLVGTYDGYVHANRGCIDNESDVGGRYSWQARGDALSECERVKGVDSRSKEKCALDDGLVGAARSRRRR